MENKSENQNPPPEDFEENLEENPEDEDDDVVEISNDLVASVSASASAMKRKLNSHVWDYFDIFVGPDKKQRGKCKKCGTTYVCPSNYGTGNLTKHIKKCKTRVTRDICQLLISREQGSVSLSINKLSCIDFFYRKFYGAQSQQFIDLKRKLQLAFAFQGFYLRIIIPWPMYILDSKKLTKLIITLSIQDKAKYMKIRQVQ
ncbi:hypothetical protein POM88_007145 [Heracleum sosnowskyi]|uniref:BED-type domain-containing protein n=1 Tax=Heracleum sosnowskyi TaxID=360622 RepID=A0AAD8J420_9APIA|nr:hypothetical protein POM88_007145 [Heracleum sosnowskyi]